MQNSNEIELDKFELQLNQEIIKLQECQIAQSVKSCSFCEKYLDCEVRDRYIKAVYNSMSKGETGGFEF